MFSIIVITLTTIFASFVGTLSGFGLGTIMTPILLLWLPFPQTIMLVAIIHWFHNIWKMLFFGHAIHWEVFIYFGIPSIAASFVGALLVGGQGMGLLLFLGVFLISYSLLLFFAPEIQLPYNRVNALIGGGLSGFFAGIFGIRGALRSVFLSAYKFPKAMYLGTIGAISALIDTTRIIIYWSSGIRLETMYQNGLIIFIVASFLGAYIGRYFVGKIPQEQFRVVVAVFLLLMGIRILLMPLVG